MAVAPMPHVLGLKPCMLGDAGEHARTDLFSVVEGKDEVGPSGAREDTMGPILPFDAPAHTQQSRKDSSRSRAGPGTLAATKEILNRSEPASPWSRRAATTRSPSAWTLAFASSGVCPYVSVPGSSRTSAIQRPSS